MGALATPVMAGNWYMNVDRWLPLKGFEPVYLFNYIQILYSARRKQKKNSVEGDSHPIFLCLYLMQDSLVWAVLSHK